MIVWGGMDGPNSVANSGGVLTLAASIVAGMPLPLRPAQLLWINLVTDGISTFPLAYEREHGDVMRRSPRTSGAGLVPKDMLISILFAGFIMMSAFGTVETAGVRVACHLFPGSTPEDAKR